jgi:hypothetical protein
MYTYECLARPALPFEFREPRLGLQVFVKDELQVANAGPL